MLLMPPELMVVTIPQVVGMASLSGVVVVASFGLVYKTMTDAAAERDKHREERREERRVRELEAESKAAATRALGEALGALRERN